MDSGVFSAGFGFDLAFAKDLNISPAVLSFFVPGFESDLLRVLVTAEACGVERPEVLSSEALPLRAEVENSLSFATNLAVGGFATGFKAGFAFKIAGGGGGGAYLAVLRCEVVSVQQLNPSIEDEPYLDIGILYGTIRSPLFHGITVGIFGDDIVITCR